MAERRSPKSKVGVPFPQILPHPKAPEEIPDDYIKQNFVLDDFRRKDKVIAEYIPFMHALAERLKNAYEYSVDSRRETIDIPIDIATDVVKQMLPSTAGSGLYDTAKLVRVSQVFDLQISARKWNSLDTYELILYRNKVIRETDAKVIERLKKMVFEKLPPPPKKKKKKVLK